MRPAWFVPVRSASDLVKRRRASRLRISARKIFDSSWDGLCALIDPFSGGSGPVTGRCCRYVTSRRGKRRPHDALWQICETLEKQ